MRVLTKDERAVYNLLMLTVKWKKVKVPVKKNPFKEYEDITEGEL